MARDTISTVLGISLIVFGILMILGEFRLQSLLPFAGIALIILGILVLAKLFPGGTPIGVVALVAGILLLEGFFDLPKDVRDVTDPVFRVINIIAGAVLLALGIGKLRHG